MTAEAIRHICCVRRGESRDSERLGGSGLDNDAGLGAGDARVQGVRYCDRLVPAVLSVTGKV